MDSQNDKPLDGSKDIDRGVVLFAILMQYELNANKDKGDWKAYKPGKDELVRELYHHLTKLIDCLYAPEDVARHLVSEHSADLANFAMKTHYLYGVELQEKVEFDALLKGNAKTGDLGILAEPGKLPEVSVNLIAQAARGNEQNIAKETAYFGAPPNPIELQAAINERNKEEPFYYCLNCKQRVDKLRVEAEYVPFCSIRCGTAYEMTLREDVTALTDALKTVVDNEGGAE